KMDRAGYDREVFERIGGAYRAHAQRLGVAGVACIPLSAALGENVVARSTEIGWYRGPSVLEYLEQAPVSGGDAGAPLRLPVQAVLRDDDGTRWLGATLAAGRLRTGDAVRVEPGGTPSTVAGLRVAGAAADSATAGQAVAVRLADDVDA